MDYSRYNQERHGYVITCEHKDPNIGVCYVGEPYIVHHYREAIIFISKEDALRCWDRIKNILLNNPFFSEKYDSYKLMKVHEEISMEEDEELTPDRILSEIEIVPVEE